MIKICFALLIVLSISAPVLADGPVEFQGTKPADESNPNLHPRQRVGGSFTKKREVVLSTVGPVPVGTVPQAAVLPGSGSGLNVKDLNVLVAPPGLIPPNGANPPAPSGTVYVTP